MLPSSIDEIDQNLANENLASDMFVTFDPSNIEKLRSNLFYESSLTQWLLTRWRKLLTDDSFKISGNLDEMELLGRIANSSPGLILALLPTGKVANITRRTSAVFREKFLTNQKSWPDLALSNSTNLLCLDSYPSTFPEQLYPAAADGQLTDWDGFRKVIEGLIRSVAADTEVRGKITERSNHISTIIYELFKNTHDHARQDHNGRILGDSIRGLHSHFYTIESLQAVISAKKEESLNPVERYVLSLLQPYRETLNTEYKKRDISGFLELSVFDSGPGLAAKWLGHDIRMDSAQVQLDAVLACFGKGRTSLPTGGRGFGLWKVLEQLKQIKGLIRVRTNQVHVVRHYANLENRQTETEGDGYVLQKEVLFDWRRGITQKPSDYPSVEGTLVSVLLPLGEL